MASSPRSSRRAMAASEEGNASANARKKPRIGIGPDSDSERETEESHGHEEEDCGEEEEEESQGEYDGDGAVEPAPVVVLTVEDADALECGVCCLPLRPPIFQCEVGHVVCAPCRDKLAPAGKCHVCGVAVAGSRLCHAVENLVEAIRVACPHTAHGCAARPAYYDLDAHRQACPHAPCYCPGEGCGFVGSTAALLHHFAAVHHWPCTTTNVVRAGKDYKVASIHLHDGFNFLRVDDHHSRGSATASHHLVMLNMTREPLGRSISALCIHPHSTTIATSRIQCDLSLSRYGNHGDGDRCRSHYQRSEFDVGYSDLANGLLPDLHQCFQFLVPTCVVGDDDQGGIRINIGITIY